MPGAGAMPRQAGAMPRPGVGVESVPTETINCPKREGAIAPAEVDVGVEVVCPATQGGGN